MTGTAHACPRALGVVRGTLAATVHQVVDAFGTTFWWIFALSLVPLVLAVFLPGQRRGRPAAGATAPAGDGEREG
ncbi:MAG: hypothetical protein WAX29_06195 [Propionibacterium sp.]